MSPIQNRINKLQSLFITQPEEALFQAADSLDIEEYEKFILWSESFIAGPWV